MSRGRLTDFIGGAWVQSSATEVHPVANPATGEPLCETPLGAAGEVERAVSAATAAFGSWRAVPALDRARVLFRFKALLDDHKDELARLVTLEHGKTVPESAGEVRRGIENVEHACGIPSLMFGDMLEDVARGIDCESVRQPIGVFAGISPFNFPAMIPLWFWPYAVATGNTFVLKPSEQVPLAQRRITELAAEAGLPAGVLNLVNGGRACAEALCDHPGIAGISFVGSTPVAKAIYARASAAGKRVQALGGAKNHILVMPDADLAMACEIATESVFGCAGQRCLAGSVVVGIGSAYERLADALVRAAKALVIGDGGDARTVMGPLVSARQRERVIAYIDQAITQGAVPLIDGRAVGVPSLPRGHFLGPTIFAEVRDEMTIARDEVFGPVMILRRAADLDEAIAMVRRSEYANACSIVTQSGAAARKFRHEVGVSMLGVNIGVAAPMAFFPFGGHKSSFFGDLKAHGADAIRFFTDAKVVISRW